MNLFQSQRINLLDGHIRRLMRKTLGHPAHQVSLLDAFFLQVPPDTVEHLELKRGFAASWRKQNRLKPLVEWDETIVFGQMVAHTGLAHISFLAFNNDYFRLLRAHFLAYSTAKDKSVP